MLKHFRDRIALSGVTVLFLGVVLLIFTFVSAYGFLTESLSIIATEDLVRTFGEALAPLIATCIRIMYLGVMGWIASLITIRGVTIIANSPKLETSTALPQVLATAQPKQVAQKPKEPQKESKPPAPKPAEPKPPEPKLAEPRSPEPEIIVIPPEEAAQPQIQPPENKPPQQAANQ